MNMQIWVAILFDMHYFLTVQSLKAILMKGGSLAEAAVVRAGYNFNHPLRVGHVATFTAANKVKEIMESIQFSGTPNVVLDTVKRGEDDNDVTSTPIKKRDSRNLILRIYEAYGGKGTAKVST
jgi:alpha-mannosidase